MQINSAMIVIFTIMLTDLAVMNVNTHVLQDLIALLKVSEATFLLVFSFFLESASALILFWGKIIFTCIFMRIAIEQRMNLSLSIKLTIFLFSSPLLTFFNVYKLSFAFPQSFLIFFFLCFSLSGGINYQYDINNTNLVNGKLHILSHTLQTQVFILCLSGRRYHL